MLTKFQLGGRFPIGLHQLPDGSVDGLPPIVNTYSVSQEMPSQLFAERSPVAGGEQIQVQPLGQAVEGQELAGQEGLSGGRGQLPHIPPRRGVRQAHVFRPHPLVGLHPQGDIPVVTAHHTRTFVPVGIDPRATPQIDAVGIEGVAHLAFQLIPAVGQPIIFRDDGHPIDGQIRKGTPAALPFPVVKATGLDTQVGVLAGLPQPVAGQKVAGIERVALLAK